VPSLCEVYPGICLTTEEKAKTSVRYKIDLVGVQEVRCDKGGKVKAGDYNFFYRKGNENRQLGIGFLYTTE
jgi:hypothetical protein